jgi:hypothetical protein
METIPLAVRTDMALAMESALARLTVLSSRVTSAPAAHEIAPRRLWAKLLPRSSASLARRGSAHLTVHQRCAIETSHAPSTEPDALATVFYTRAR